MSPEIDNWQNEGGACYSQEDDEQYVRCIRCGWLLPHKGFSHFNYDATAKCIEVFQEAKNDEIASKSNHDDILTTHWSKCNFCGVSNGKFGTILKQHRPRCRWLGDADKFENMHHSYNQMIIEDDPTHLSMMQAHTELELCKKELTKPGSL